MLWQARRWRFLLNIIDRLPAHSRYAEAVSDDDDAADFFLAAGGTPGPETSRLADWSPEVVELRRVVDRLGALLTATVAAAGSRPPTMPVLPRPTTALDRSRRRAALARHRQLVAQVIPDSPTLIEGA